MSLSRRQLLHAAGAASLGAATTQRLHRRSAAAQTAGDKEPVTIQFWTHDQNYIDFFTARAAELTESPDSPYAYELNITQAPSADIITKAVAAYSAGRGIPDTVGIEISQFSRFMQRGVAEQTLLDLTDRVAELRDQFFESRWAPYTVDGRVYAVESGYPLSVYYYRQDLLDEYGVETPLETWDQVMQIGREVVVPQGKAMAAISTTGGQGGGDITQFGLLFQQRGGTFFDADGNLTLDTPEAVEVAELLATGLQEGTILGLTDFYGGPGAAAMQQGATVGYFMPDWFETYVLQPTVPDQEGLWRIQPLPAFAGGGSRTSVWGGTGFAVSRDSPVAEATWELLRYGYLTRDGQIKRWQEIKYLPTMAEVWDDPALTGPDPFLGGQEAGQVYKELAPTAPTQYQSPFWNQLTVELAGQLAELYNGRTSPADAIKNAAAAIQAEMG
jgi:multiple sugar transport system substrate-binding protein/arabinosaccharide transport system substrate-binding protein